MKHRLGALALAAVLAGSLSPAALAASPAEIVLNGNKLDTTGLPTCAGLPMRLIAEEDHGFADWYEEDNQGVFYLGDHQITVQFDTNAVEVDGTILEGIHAQVEQGVTFLPPSVLEGLEGYTVTADPQDGQKLTITTPNNDPMIQLAYQIIDASGMGYSARATLEQMEEYHQIHAASFTQGIGFFPMMTSPDTLVLVKLAEDGEEAAKADLERYRKQQEDTFSWYLSQNLPKVQNAKLVIADGWLLFLIAEDAEAGAALFQSSVEALSAP
ncbi:MAG: DUF4358 domain-containing protein [Oscillospiraceae bacterium]|nr:DUF4358 domain-containing protein [Oscillospiraceae bacterium]